MGALLAAAHGGFWKELSAINSMVPRNGAVRLWARVPLQVCDENCKLFDSNLLRASRDPLHELC